MGKLDEAETHARKAYAMANEMGYTRTVASALIILGDIYAKRQKADQAKEQYKAALVLAQSLQIPMLLSRVNERLERIGGR
jgi:tetratricopeptide (TPR) repeat protein